jgi:hypothetical protein
MRQAGRLTLPAACKAMGQGTSSGASDSGARDAVVKQL